MVKLSRKLRKNRCARNGRKNNQLGGVITNQWTFDGSKIAGVNNYGQVNKVFTDCDYKAPSISVPAGGLPGFAPAATPAGPLGFLKFWGGKRRTGRKGKRSTMRGGGGGIGYSRTDFEVVGGVNPIANQRALGCESGAVGPSSAASALPIDAAAKPWYQFWGGRRLAKRLSKRSTQRKRRTHRKMRGGASDLASAFAPPMNPTSPLTLTAPYSAANPVYEVPSRAGFSTDAPAGGNNAGMPPYEQYNANSSRPVPSGPCIQPQTPIQKGGKRSAKHKTRKTRKSKKRTHRKH
jgi:hypothetical protein